MTALSVLDLVTVRSDQTTGDAIAASRRLAQAADELGYRRYWVAEHHNMPAVASTNPPVIIAMLAAATQRIKVGSGGVMLPNHAPLVVAEQFALLEAAFAEWDAAPLLARLAELGVPAGKVRTLDEVYEWEQTRSQGLLVDVEHASLGRITLPGPPLRFFATDPADGDGLAEVTRRRHQAPPTLDADGAAIRAWLGLPPPA